MALRNFILIFLVAMALCGGCYGSVYKVGDSNGWTSRGLVDYNKWTSSKDFHVGDTLLFSYNNQFHNVIQVSNQDFKSCNTTSAIGTYTSGSDAITLKRPGHFYFLCGTPYHCQAGQKVEIKVTLPIPDMSIPSSSPNPSPSHSNSEASPSIVSSGSPTLKSSKFTLAVTTFVLCFLGFVF